MARRLFWNPGWNEALYLTTCAERLIEMGGAHAHDEIARAVLASPAAGCAQLRFRVIVLERRDDTVVGEEVFVSAPLRRTDA